MSIVHILNDAIETGALDLSYPVLNFLDSDAMALLLMRIKNDMRIHTIDLSGNKLSLIHDDQLTLLCALLSEMPYIQTLVLSTCHLASMMPENLRQLSILVITMPNLQRVDLSNNRLGGHTQIFVNHLAQVRHTMNIDLRRNGLGYLYQQDFARLFQAMNRLPDIQFDVRNNLLLDEDDEWIQNTLIALNLQPHFQFD